MKLGYPTINWTLSCKADRTFRLKSYSTEKLLKIVENNLNCLLKILEFNKKNNLLFFRITSKLIPFASHPINTFDWQNYFNNKFKKIGKFINANQIRISMHPDQFILINPLDEEIFRKSVEELKYHADVLELMQLDYSAKIQLHLGGVYGDKEKSMGRFIKRYQSLEERIKKRLVIENDDKSYNLSDCLRVSSKINIPVLFDYFHHEINNMGETLEECFQQVTITWKTDDGVPLVDYSSQHPKRVKGSHAESIDSDHFMNFLEDSKPYDFDIMLEIKDKEKSALEALLILKKDTRFKV
jgi:UV DNA damage endonuclease